MFSDGLAAKGDFRSSWGGKVRENELPDVRIGVGAAVLVRTGFVLSATKRWGGVGLERFKIKSRRVHKTWVGEKEFGSGAYSLRKRDSY